MTDDETAWMSRAECNPDPAWTSDHKPHPGLLRLLSQICDRGPVMADCAQYALENPHDVRSGVYAGVWIPWHHNRREWHAARDSLHRKTRTLVS